MLRCTNIKWVVGVHNFVLFRKPKPTLHPYKLQLQYIKLLTLQYIDFHIASIEKKLYDF